MIPRGDFIAGVALSLVSQGRAPNDAARDAVALALNLEKRDASLWRSDPSPLTPPQGRPLLAEEFGTGDTYSPGDLAGWLMRRYSDENSPVSRLKLPPGRYRVVFYSLDNPPEKT